MELIINGTARDIPEDRKTVGSLVEHLQLGGKKAVVERNGTIIKKDKHDEEPVKEGDKLEIVHFVGGG
ncbi:sulfur carrier protein ThiS [Salibacterium lacus]|uniref:Sulfur carrier protein ThiS n=1 Tax=Salibacterium lacus TaxID=1898109 RepID=A0ABW5T1V4_9BACI